jgi:hypothetical protein
MGGGDDDDVLDAMRLQGSVSLLARWRASRWGAPTYQRLADANVERRVEPRRVSRLKWGKVLDGADRFLCDCVIADRAEDGARLRLARNLVLPPLFQLFDEDSGEIYAAQIVWRRGVEIGCRLSRSGAPSKAQAARRMKNRYYAI